MNNEIWKSKDGTTISVDDMTELHAKNSLKMIIRKLREMQENKGYEINKHAEEAWEASVSGKWNWKTIKTLD